jgi:hypothetical protein
VSHRVQSKTHRPPPLNPQLTRVGLSLLQPTHLIHREVWMVIRAKGPGPTIPEPFKNYYLSRRPKNNTAVIQQSTKTARACDRCQRLSLKLSRFVELADGVGRDYCHTCYRWIAGTLPSAPAHRSRRRRRRSREFSAAQRQLAALFRLARPQGSTLGADRRSPIAPRSPIAATTARIVFAKFAEAEGRATCELATS